MVAVAIGGAAVVGAGASMAASSKASKTAKKTAASNNALQTQIYNENKTTLAPFVGQGGVVTPTINGLLGLGGDPTAAQKAFDTFTGSDGYQFRLNEGQKAVQSALGARGYLDSGAAQKALLKYGQGTASDEFSRYMGYLTGQQGVGLTAASAQAGVGQGYASNVAANNNNAANTASNAALANAGSINSALNSAVSSYALNSGLKSSYGGTQPVLHGGSVADPAWNLSWGT